MNKDIAAYAGIKVVGIDLGQRSFHLHGADRHGQVVVQRRLSRSQLHRLLAQLPRVEWRWRRAAGPTSGGAWLASTATRCA